MQGIYRGTYRHEADIDCVLQRAIEAGVHRIILTAGTVDESRAAVHHARKWNEKRYSHDSSSSSDRRPLRFTCTVGVHPTRCSQVFEATPDTNARSILDELYEICVDGMKDQTVVAIGEIGLDYDRLDFCPRDVQQKYLIQQLECLAQRTGLPLFLHNRSVGDDLYRILTEYRHCWQHSTSKDTNQATDEGAEVPRRRSGEGGGVVHSFDDTIELATKFTNDLGLYIGLNGCSLRTEQNLETVAQLPLDRILLETEYVVFFGVYSCCLGVCRHCKYDNKSHAAISLSLFNHITSRISRCYTQLPLLRSAFDARRICSCAHQV
jgi:TatD DNase family protein